MDNDLRVRIAERLLEVLCSCAVDVESCNIFRVFGSFDTFDACDVTQFPKLLAIKGFIACLQRLILFPPLQGGCELLFGFLEVVDIGSEELLEDDEGRMGRGLAETNE